MNPTGPRTPATGRAAPHGYLRELGIDVWVRRDGRRPERSGAASLVPPEHPPADSTGPAATFDIRGFRIGRVLALIDAPLWPHRRFFLDVALAMNGWGTDRREDVRFEWPQPLSGDGGEEAASRAFRAFVAAQSGDDGRILAVGKAVAGLLGEAASGAVLAVDEVVYGADRRDLWRRVRNLR